MYPDTRDKGSGWPRLFHEIKLDGYRLIVQREGKRFRLFTKNGHDWSDRYPHIVEAALKNRTTSFVIDGEAVLLGGDRISDFNGLDSRRPNDSVQLYAFDILALGGEDLRKLPLYLGKMNLARLLAPRPDGIFASDFEQGDIGPALFAPPATSVWKAWSQNGGIAFTVLGDHLSWVKNRQRPAMEKVKEAFS